MSEYEDRQKKVSEAYKEYREEFYTKGSGSGDQGKAEKNQVMQGKTEKVSEALREAYAVAPSDSEKENIADAIVRTDAEARDFAQRANHYKSKRDKG